MMESLRELAASAFNTAKEVARWGVQHLMVGVEQQTKHHLWKPVLRTIGQAGSVPPGWGPLLLEAGGCIVFAAGRAAMLAQPAADDAQAEEAAHQHQPPAGQGLWNDLFPARRVRAARAAASQEAKWLACGLGLACIAASTWNAEGVEAGVAARAVFHYVVSSTVFRLVVSSSALPVQLLLNQLARPGAVVSKLARAASAAVRRAAAWWLGGEAA